MFNFSSVVYVKTQQNKKLKLESNILFSWACKTQAQILQQNQAPPTLLMHWWCKLVNILSFGFLIGRIFCDFMPPTWAVSACTCPLLYKKLCVLMLSCGYRKCIIDDRSFDTLLSWANTPTPTLLFYISFFRVFYLVEKYLLFGNNIRSWAGCELSTWNWDLEWFAQSSLEKM